MGQGGWLPLWEGAHLVSFATERLTLSILCLGGMEGAVTLPGWEMFQQHLWPLPTGYQWPASHSLEL